MICLINIIVVYYLCKVFKYTNNRFEKYFNELNKFVLCIYFIDKF